MKKIKILIMSLLVLSFFACDQEDAIVDTIYDSVNGQTGIGFTASSLSVAVREEGASVTVPVQATTLSTSDRSFNVTVDDESSFVGSSSDYTVGTITIPANSYDGSFDVSFVDDNLVDQVAYSLVLNLDLSGGLAGVGAKTVTINYNKYLICNDLELVINTDTFGDETSWEITDSMGAVVQSGGPLDRVSGGATFNWAFNLPDGDYTFTIFDTFGDGLFDGSVTGNYTLSCLIITHATGSGNFGSSQSTDFSVNP